MNHSYNTWKLYRAHIRSYKYISRKKERECERRTTWGNHKSRIPSGGNRVIEKKLSKRKKITKIICKKKTGFESGKRKTNQISFGLGDLANYAGPGIFSVGLRVGPFGKLSSPSELWLQWSSITRKNIQNDSIQAKLKSIRCLSTKSIRYAQKVDLTKLKLFRYKVRDKFEVFIRPRCMRPNWVKHTAHAIRKILIRPMMPRYNQV